MKIVVFGATGQTGQQVVHLLVKEGHVVTAFARTSSNVNTHSGKVIVIQGDARDSSAVANAVAQQDAVISTLGPRSLKRDNLQELFAKNLVAAMQVAGVKRLIELSARGAGESSQQNDLLFKIVQGTLLKSMFADKNRAESIITASNLEYTFVRPGRLTNGGAKGGVRASLNAKGLSIAISRRDVADFIVRQLKDTAWVRKAPLIGY